LFSADREEDAALNIGPALAAGKLILMDRYYYSNAAYQGENAGMAGQILKTNLDMGFPLPDRVFFLDLDPAEALRRLAGRSGTAIDCFEREDRLTAIRGNYLAILDERCTIVDASAPAETVAGIIAEEILLRAR
jgi:dTMP kinase